MVVSQQDPGAGDEPWRARDNRHEFGERSREGVSVGDRGLDYDGVHGVSFLVTVGRYPALHRVVATGNSGSAKALASAR